MVNKLCTTHQGLTASTLKSDECFSVCLRVEHRTALAHRSEQRNKTCLNLIIHHHHHLLLHVNINRATTLDDDQIKEGIVSSHLSVCVCVRLPVTNDVETRQRS